MAPFTRGAVQPEADQLVAEKHHLELIQNISLSSRYDDRKKFRGLLHPTMLACDRHPSDFLVSAATTMATTIHRSHHLSRPFRSHEQIERINTAQVKGIATRNSTGSSRTFGLWR